MGAVQNYPEVPKASTCQLFTRPSPCPCSPNEGVWLALLRPHLYMNNRCQRLWGRSSVGELCLIRGSRSLRAAFALAALAASLALAGCNTEGIPTVPARALEPISKEMMAELDRKQMPVSSPILVRIFKEEAELE